MLPFFLFILYILLFLTGMAVMRSGLMMLSGESVNIWISRFTKTPLIGMIFGIFVTILLQSSSAVMIIAIGLISAKILSFEQSIGLILGTNIGTTATLEFLAYSSDQFILPLFLIGGILLLFSKRKGKAFGFFCYGLGGIFLAMRGFENLAVHFGKMEALLPFFTEMNEHFYLAAIIGCIITAIIQSSTAMTGIAMGFIHSGIINLPAAIAIMFGANIGTCADAYIAAIGGGRDAKRAAFAHIYVNVIGVMAFLPFTIPFSEFVEALSPNPEVQIAHASVLFNVAVSLLFLPIATRFADVIKKIH